MHRAGGEILTSPAKPSRAARRRLAHFLFLAEAHLGRDLRHRHAEAAGSPQQRSLSFTWSPSIRWHLSAGNLHRRVARVCNVARSGGRSSFTPLALAAALNIRFAHVSLRRKGHLVVKVTLFEQVFVMSSSGSRGISSRTGISATDPCRCRTTRSRLDVEIVQRVRHAVEQHAVVVVICWLVGRPRHSAGSRSTIAAAAR